MDLVPGNFFFFIFLNYQGHPTILLASVMTGYPYFVISNPFGSKGKYSFFYVFILITDKDVINAMSDIIQTNIHPSKISKWLEHCSKAFEAWNSKKALKEDKTKRKGEEMESGEEEVTEATPPKKIRKKVLVPDENVTF